MPWNMSIYTGHTIKRRESEKMPAYINVILRAFSTYIILIIALRLMGRRELSQLSFIDYIVAICIGGVGGRSITKLDEPYILFVLGFATLAVAHVALSYIKLKSPALRRLVNGEPVIMIHKGNIIRKNLKKSHISLDTLMSLLRDKSVFKISDVEYALLEPSGGISVILKSELSPLTPNDMNIQKTKNELPVVVIKEGKIVREELTRGNLTEEWLREQLQKNNISDISKLLLVQADQSGIIYSAFFEEVP